ADLGDLLRRGLVVRRDVTVRAHQEVPGVVREEVQQHVRGLAARDDQSFRIGMLRRLAERALLAQHLGSRLDVRHPVRGPQPLELVGYTGQVPPVLDGAARIRRARLGGCGCHARSSEVITRAWDAMARRMRSTASATGTPFSCDPSRKRKETVPAARSCSPAMRMSGTLAVV